MEIRLKQDILKEAQQYNSRFLIHDESSDGKMIQIWQDVSEATVLTPKEAYSNLAKQNYPVTFKR